MIKQNAPAEQQISELIPLLNPTTTKSVRTEVAKELLSVSRENKNWDAVVIARRELMWSGCRHHISERHSLQSLLNEILDRSVTNLDAAIDDLSWFIDDDSDNNLRYYRPDPRTALRELLSKRNSEMNSE